MTLYRFINIKTRVPAKVADVEVERIIPDRSLSEDWLAELRSICAMLGWSIEDVVGISRKGLFAFVDITGLSIRIERSYSDDVTDRVLYFALW